MARYWHFKPHFNHEQQILPGLSPGMPWPAATYDGCGTEMVYLAEVYDTIAVYLAIGNKFKDCIGTSLG